MNDNDDFLQQIRRVVETLLIATRASGSPGEPWIEHAPSDLVHSYLELKILERLETLITLLKSPGRKL